MVLCQSGQPRIDNRELAKGLAGAAELMADGMPPAALLKAIGMKAMEKTEGVSDLCKYNPNHYPEHSGKGGQFAPNDKAGDNGSTSAGSSRIQVAANTVDPVVMTDASESSADENAKKEKERQERNDKAYPYKVLTLRDGSVVIGTNGKPITMPKDVSLYDNVRIGDSILDELPPTRYGMMVGYFAPHIGVWDYQRTCSTDKLYNRRYIDFGNFNYGAVAAAAGYDETESIIYAAAFNQFGSGNREGLLWGNKHNERMIRAGWNAYTNGNIPIDSQR